MKKLILILCFALVGCSGADDPPCDEAEAIKVINEVYEQMIKKGETRENADAFKEKAMEDPCGSIASPE